MRTLWSAAPKILKVAVVSGAIFVSFATSPAAQAQDSMAAQEAQSRDLVNAARASAGVGALQANSGLDQIARAQAARMVARDAIYHNPNLHADADAAGVNWVLIGENVGVGPDAQAVHNGFMASPGHRANVVHADYDAIGVGVALAQDGSVFVTQAFAKLAPAAAAPAPAPQVEAPAPVEAPPAQAPAPSEAPAPAAPVEVLAATETPTPAEAALPTAVVGGVTNPAPIS